MTFYIEYPTMQDREERTNPISVILVYDNGGLQAPTGEIYFEAIGRGFEPFFSLDPKPNENGFVHFETSLSYLLNYCREINWQDVPISYQEHLEKMANYSIFSVLKEK